MPATEPRAAGANGNALYRTVWRWHFYAGLFVIPFVMLLALSGTVFLFKPQVDRWEERAFLPATQTAYVAPSAQIQSALAAFPGASFHSVRLPAESADAALVHLTLPDARMRDVFVAPDGQVLGSLDAGTRITEVARRIHGQLLMGERGSWLVELAACWAIVMIITGLYLWWPRGRGPAGVLWPRRGTPLRDLHAVTGFWVSAFALVLLLTGLPWTSVWGGAFEAMRVQMGWVKGPATWSTDGQGGHDHAAHDHDAMHAHTSHYELLRIDTVVAHAAEEAIAPPVVLLAPGSARFGAPSPHWVLTSGTQNRPLATSITYDRDSGAQIARESFADLHPVDRAVGYGLAWHEGALFGAVTQIIGLLTAIALVAMSVTGFLMWRRRRPAGQLGAPPLPADLRKPVFVALVVLTLAVLLPLLAASLLVLLLFDLVLPRLLPSAAAWLGIRPRAPLPR